jgi:hypothetical protein
MAQTPEELPRLIAGCNETLHFGLPEVRHEKGLNHLTPNEVGNDRDQHWKPEVYPTWTVDDVTHPFSETKLRRSSSDFLCAATKKVINT